MICFIIHFTILAFGLVFHVSLTGSTGAVFSFIGNELCIFVNASSTPTEAINVPVAGMMAAPGPRPAMVAPVIDAPAFATCIAAFTALLFVSDISWHLCLQDHPFGLTPLTYTSSFAIHFHYRIVFSKNQQFNRSNFVHSSSCFIYQYDIYSISARIFHFA